MTSQVLHFGSEKIEFKVGYSSRKSLGISVNPDLSVDVRAPHGASMVKIHEKVKKRAPWIIKQRARFERYPQKRAERRYVSGESFYYLGRQYRLKVVKALETKATLSRGVFTVHILNKDAGGAVRKVVEKWLRERAAIYFQKRLETLVSKLKYHTVQLPILQLKTMPKRWGSCTKGGKIILNPNLIKAPSHCIDYVIMHELCHLVIHNHSPEYWSLLKKVMPDWRARKERLEMVEL
jgi:predicted metal-dependent hydrolase